MLPHAAEVRILLSVCHFCPRVKLRSPKLDPGEWSVHLISLVFPEKTARQRESVWYPVRPLSIKRQDGAGGRDVNVPD